MGYGRGLLLVELLEEAIDPAFFGGELVRGRDEAVGGVGDDVFDDREGFGDGFGGGFGEVEGGDLEAVEEEASTFGVEVALGDALQDESDTGLDGAAVFGQREVEGGEGVAVGKEGVGGRFGGPAVVVVEAEELSAEGAAAAAAAVGEDVAALVGFGLSFGLDLSFLGLSFLGHGVWGPPSPWKYVKCSNDGR